LFDNEIEVPLFEDQMRFMFGPRVVSCFFSGYLPSSEADPRVVGSVQELHGRQSNRVNHQASTWNHPSPSRSFVRLTILQVQTIFTDAKSHDLYSLFKKESQQPSDEVRYREAAAQVLGDLEHLFRIEMARTHLFELSENALIITSCLVGIQLPHLNVFTIQLLGKDDPNQEDPEIYIDRWRLYITSYASVGDIWHWGFDRLPIRHHRRPPQRV
jgi:paired amphipathic helix protein Sin3a